MINSTLGRNNMQVQSPLKDLKKPLLFVDQRHDYVDYHDDEAAPAEPLNVKAVAWAVLLILFGATELFFRKALATK